MQAEGVNFHACFSLECIEFQDISVQASGNLH